MKKKIASKVMAAIFLSVLLLPLSAASITFAADPTPPIGVDGGGTNVPVGTQPGGTRLPVQTSNQPITIQNPLQARNFSELINRIANWLLVLGAPVLTLMIIIGAFQILSAAGNPEKVKTGRQTITWAIVGYALLLISTGITALIKNVLSVN